VSAERPSGAQLHAELLAAADAAGVPLPKFAQPLAPRAPHGWLITLRQAAHPLPLTVERVRALIAGREIPESRRTSSFWADPSPSTGAGGSGGVRPDICETRALRERKQELGERAHAERRAGETLGDALRRIGREVDAEDRAVAEERRERELIEMGTPGTLIRRAQRDWPEQCTKVAALAAEMGVAKGEAWARVIAAGIDSLTDGGCR
jgi:hypothetical protein